MANIIEHNPVEHSVAPLQKKGDQEQSNGQRGFSLSLQKLFLLFSLVVIFVTAAVIFIPFNSTARENVDDLARKVNAETSLRVVTEVSNLLQSAELAQESLYQMFVASPDLMSTAQNREQVFFSILKANPSFSWVSLGLSNGNFFGVQRADPVNFRIVDSRHGKRSFDLRNTQKLLFANGEYIDVGSSVSRKKYDARERPWYKLATSNEGRTIWTDLYVFSTSGKPGLNTARTLPVSGSSDSPNVISIALELERLSTFLGSVFQPSADSAALREGTGFIMTADRKMVAFPDRSQIVMASSEPGAKPKPRLLNETTNPHLRLVSEALATGELSTDLLDKPTTVLVEDRANLGTLFYVTLSSEDRLGWVVGTIIPASVFLATINKNNQVLMLVLGVILIVVSILSIIAARIIFVRPLRKMVDQMGAIEQFRLHDVEKISSVVSELKYLSGSMDKMRTGLESFGRYLPRQLLAELLKKDQIATIGGERRTLTVMFSDIASFTTVSEKLGYGLAEHLATYFEAMSQRIVRHNGVIDKYIGDAIMAFWGAPTPNENHATDACSAAVSCRDELARQSQASASDDVVFSARFGISTGRVLVGNFGSNNQLSYTVIGDPVNLASRLEGLNKEFGTSILIGPTTFQFARYEIIARRLDQVTVKGKSEAVDVYELLDMHEGWGPPNIPDWVRIYEAGLNAYLTRDLDDAIERFNQTNALRPGGDLPSRVMIQRCQKIASDRMTEKMISTQKSENLLSQDAELVKEDVTEPEVKGIDPDT